MSLMLPASAPHRLLAAVVLAVVIGVAGDAAALRCGNKLVRVGDDAAKVLRRCGEPAFVTRRQVWRNGGRRHTAHGTIYYRGDYSVDVEEWTYDRGPRRFGQRLVFENGYLVEIERLGYGN